VVPSLVTERGLVDRTALDAFLANATTDPPRALRRPAAREVERMASTLEGKERQTKIELLDQSASAYLAEATRDVKPIWPDLARRLQRVRDRL
jgi:hypothetical protein